MLYSYLARMWGEQKVELEKCDYMGCEQLHAVKDFVVENKWTTAAIAAIIIEAGAEYRSKGIYAAAISLYNRTIGQKAIIALLEKAGFTKEQIDAIQKQTKGGLNALVDALKAEDQLFKDANVERNADYADMHIRKLDVAAMVRFANAFIAAPEAFTKLENVAAVNSYLAQVAAQKDEEVVVAAPVVADVDGDKKDEVQVENAPAPVVADYAVVRMLKAVGGMFVRRNPAPVAAEEKKDGDVVEAEEKKDEAAPVVAEKAPALKGRGVMVALQNYWNGNGVLAGWYAPAAEKAEDKPATDDADAKAKAEADAKAKAEADAIAKAEADAKAKADAETKDLEERMRKLKEAEAKATKEKQDKAEADRKAAEAEAAKKKAALNGNGNANGNGGKINNNPAFQRFQTATNGAAAGAPKKDDKKPVVVDVPAGTNANGTGTDVPPAQQPVVNNDDVAARREALQKKLAAMSNK